MGEPMPGERWRVVLLVAALLVAGVVMPVSWLSRLTLGSREQLTPVIIPAALLLYWTFGLRRRLGMAAGLTVTAGLFLLPLLGLWLTGASNFAVAGGLVPWSDAGDYYYNAQRLLEGLPLGEFSARRALFVGMLAGLLEVTSRDLQVALLAMVLVNAIAAYGAARAVQRTHGRVAAVVLMLLLFLYYRRIAGTTLTENLGFSLGTLGFTLLWGAAQSRATMHAVYGIAVLTMALNARNGPFLVLPALIVWAAFCLCHDGARRWRTGALAVGIVAAGFAASSALVRTVGVPGGQPFSDFPDTFYGIAAGGKRWVQVYVDHPEVAALPLHDHNREVMRLAWSLIRSQPSGVLLSTVKAYGNFLGLPGPFHFIDPMPPGVENIAYRAILSASALGAMWMMWRRRSDPHASLLLAALTGILLSVPFIPPSDSDRLRVYAATVPLTAALVAVGAGLVAARRLGHTAPRSVSVLGLAAGTGAAALLLLSGVGALAPWEPTRVPDQARGPCSAGLEKALVRLDRGLDQRGDLARPCRDRDGLGQFRCGSGVAAS